MTNTEKFHFVVIVGTSVCETNFYQRVLVHVTVGHYIVRGDINLSLVPPPPPPPQTKDMKSVPAVGQKGVSGLFGSGKNLLGIHHR